MGAGGPVARRCGRGADRLRDGDRTGRAVGRPGWQRGRAVLRDDDRARDARLGWCRRPHRHPAPRERDQPRPGRRGVPAGRGVLLRDLQPVRPPVHVGGLVVLQRRDVDPPAARRPPPPPPVPDREAAVATLEMGRLAPGGLRRVRDPRVARARSGRDADAGPRAGLADGVRFRRVRGRGTRDRVRRRTVPSQPRRGTRADALARFDRRARRRVVRPPPRDGGDPRGGVGTSGRAGLPGARDPDRRACRRRSGSRSCGTASTSSTS